MFLFYYVWGFFSFIFLFFRNLIDYVFLKFNKNSMTSKRNFNELGFFEKLFLTFFSKNDEFKKSIGNIVNIDALFNYRKKKYPLIFFFHLYSNKTTYKLKNLKKLNFFFKFFNSNSLKKKTFFKINSLFVEKRGHITISAYKLFLILQKIFYKRYYNLCSSVYFKKPNDNNLIKLNWLFHIFLLNAFKKKKFYDLSKYSDWYDFVFKKKYIYNKKVNIQKKKKLNFLKYRNINVIYLKSTYSKYNLFFKKISLNLSNTYKNIYLINFNELYTKNAKVILNLNWKNNLNLFYPIRFNESSINKYIELPNVNNYLLFYIRKNRIFNKGRYSRNRQLYRTGVYWCLWLNIILVYGLYFLFYRFTFNFGYFWWGLLILFYSTIFSRSIKYNYHNFNKIFQEIFNFVDWLSFIINSLSKDIFLFIKKYQFFFLRNILYFNVFNNLYILYKNLTKSRFIYFWESMGYKDNSLFRYKTILHWLNQLYKSLTF